ncbi:hypothetical protein FBY35_7184 [Streptomyces sp. SLBN-118]|uniref:hypothetical protein n=1 Tax=Streptomyces sp. SLBN-118 TaxID=2768454 RepID=UPI00116FC592|nr:hypothetical protein [Streptomyces sp. SLBN-118]TQK45599.1 hypothetical protein FBY35_7184 [Streptomyces sp. SLBN-118]
MHDIVDLMRGPLYLYCVLVLLWELDRKTAERSLSKPWICSALAALALAELPRWSAP